MIQKLMYYFLTPKALIKYLESHPEIRKEARKYLFAPPEQEGIAMIHAYTDKHGNNYYTYEDPTKMPHKRSVAADIAARHLGMNITSEDLGKKIAQIKKLCNAGNLVDAFAIIKEIEKRLQMAVEEKTLADMACIYFLMEDENPNSVLDPAIKAKKLAMWSADNEAYLFFLEKAFYITRGFGESLKIDIGTLIQEAKDRANLNP